MKSKLATSAAETSGAGEAPLMVARWKSPFHVPSAGAGTDPYGLEIKRILRRQEIARVGFVAACVAACTVVTIAIWHLLNS